MVGSIIQYHGWVVMNNLIVSVLQNVVQSRYLFGGENKYWLIFQSLFVVPMVKCFFFISVAVAIDARGLKLSSSVDSYNFPVIANITETSACRYIYQCSEIQQKNTFYCFSVHWSYQP